MELIIDNHIIKQDIKSILDLLQSQLYNGKLRTIKYTSSGVNITCPHHKEGLEHKASCYIYTGDDPNLYWGTCHCFTCEFKGSLGRFIGECFEKDESFGNEWLKANFTERVIHSIGDKRLNELNFDPPKKKAKVKPLDESILNEFQSWHPYMAQRKLTKEIVEAFQIKYDPKTKCVVFPVRNSNGELVLLTRRSVESKKFNIEKQKEKPLYLLNEVIKRNYQVVIITEGQIDALTCWVYGYPAIATMGNPSQDQIDKLKKSGIHYVVTMFDNDDAGREFTKKVNHLLSTSKDIDITNIKWTINKKDINELTENEFNEIMKQNDLTFIKKNDILLDKGA